VPSGVAVVDLDADGDRDIAVIVAGATPGTSSVRLLRNITPLNTTGALLALEPTPLSTNDPQLILAADVDQDSRDDLVTINGAAAALLRGGDAAMSRVEQPAGAPGSAAALLPPRIAVSRAVPPCATDLNGDRVTNTADLTLLLLRFGQAAPPGSPAAVADLNADGAVNTQDLTLLLLRFGQACP